MKRVSKPGSAKERIPKVTQGSIELPLSSSEHMTLTGEEVEWVVRFVGILRAPNSIARFAIMTNCLAFEERYGPGNQVPQETQETGPSNKQRAVEKLYNAAETLARHSRKSTSRGKRVGARKR